MNGDGELTIEECQEFAKARGYKLSKFAEKILVRTNANGGYCPCVSVAEREAHPENDYTCPCSLMTKDIEETGHCHCRLFIKD